MVRNYKPKNIRRRRTTTRITDNVVELALHQVKEAGVSIRKAAKECGVHEKTIRNRLKEQKWHASGGHTSPSVESERELASLLTIKAKSGLTSTRKEICELVGKYVNANKNKENEIGEYLKTYCKFKDGFPSLDWLQNFLRRYNLSCKLNPQRRINPEAQVLVTMNELYKEFEAKQQEKNNKKRLDCDNADEPHEQEENPSNELAVKLEISDDDEAENIDDSKCCQFVETDLGMIKKNVAKNMFYAVHYGHDLSYRGKVEKVTKTKIIMKFLQRRPDDEYVWPVKDDRDEVLPQQFFAGPLQLTGTVPYKIRNVQKSHKAFQTFMKKKDMKVQEN